ncbi:MAG: SDR family oxidoreductase [Burkholderiaceae bacterium]
MKLLVTGANGFVGSAAARHLAGRGYQVLGQVRKLTHPSVLSKDELLTSTVQGLQADLTDISGFTEALQGCTAVLHCAARVHQVHETASDPLAAYMQVNRDATLALARAAASTGVQRFVFLSSIKVHGEFSRPGQPFKPDDALQPTDPYGRSKYEAEQGLREIAAHTGMQVVIVRPPLVYGPGVKANFLSMMRWLERGVPLPLGAIDNQRSLVGLGNLVDLLEQCITHPQAANQIFLASDGHDVSTTELLQAMAAALKVKPRLLPVPQAWLEGTLGLLARGGLAQRLCGNLVVDISHTHATLGWTPPYTLQQGLQATAAHFLAQR